MLDTKLPGPSPFYIVPIAALVAMAWYLVGIWWKNPDANVLGIHAEDTIQTAEKVLGANGFTADETSGGGRVYVKGAFRIAPGATMEPYDCTTTVKQVVLPTAALHSADPCISNAVPDSQPVGSECISIGMKGPDKTVEIIGQIIHIRMNETGALLVGASPALCQNSLRHRFPSSDLK